MIRTFSLAALLLAFGLTVGCSQKAPPPPDNMKSTATPVEPGKKPKSRTLEAGLEAPSK
jgi:hypothetical protein